MKKMLVVLAVLALVAMSSLAMATPPLSGQVTVSIIIGNFAEVNVITPTLGGDGTTPQNLLNGAISGIGGAQQYTGGAFKVRCNTASTLTISPDHCFTTSGHYPMAVNSTDGSGISYGVDCTLGGVTTSLNGALSQVGGILTVPVPAGVSDGHLKGSFYSDSYHTNAGGVDPLTLAPGGTYTSILTLTIAAI